MKQHDSHYSMVISCQKIRQIALEGDLHYLASM